MVTTATWRSAQLLALALITTTAAQLRAEDIVEIIGEVKTIQGNRLQVQTNERSWIVVVDSELLKESKQRTELEFHGRGRGSIVKQGMWVKFFADVDATGKTVAPVRQLTWFTPDRTTQEGAFPAEPNGDGGEPRVHWDRPQRGEIVAGHYLIVASVRGFRGGVMDVYYKEGEDVERHVFAQLAADVDIEIDVSRLEVAGKLISPGDKVEVRGRKRENQVHALSIVARREEVLGKPLLALAQRPARPSREDEDPQDRDGDEPDGAAEGALSDDDPFGVATAAEPAPNRPPAAGAVAPTRALILKVN